MYGVSFSGRHNSLMFSLESELPKFLNHPHPTVLSSSDDGRADAVPLGRRRAEARATQRAEARATQRPETPQRLAPSRLRRLRHQRRLPTALRDKVSHHSVLSI